MIYRTRPLPIIDHPADDKHHGGSPRLGPTYIWLHATGGVNSLDWLSRNPKSKVSCHRLISKDGEIYKIVPDDRIAWTQGYGVMGTRGPGTEGNYLVHEKVRYPLRIGLNHDGLSIELENLDNGHDPYPLAQIKACAAQVCEWHGLYGFLPILPHYAVDPRKMDPAGFPWQQFYYLLMQEYRSAFVVS